MKNEIVSLINAFLYETEVDRNAILDDINSFIERTFLEADLVLAQNVMRTYRDEINASFADCSKEAISKMIPPFSFLLTLLSLQEK